MTLINPFEVPAGADDDFLTRWRGVRDALAGHRGYLGTRLHRGCDAEFRFVNVARWSSPLMFARAIRSVDAAGMPDDEPFRTAVREHVEFGSRVAMQNSNATSDAELHPLREVPRWTWAGDD